MISCLSALLTAVSPAAAFPISEVSAVIAAIPQEKSKKLILHFDVNRTLIMEDAVGGKSFHDNIIYCLGDKFKDRWDEKVSEPISYNDYVKFYLLPGPSTDKALRAQRLRKICGFIEYLKEINHPYKESAEAKYLTAIKTWNPDEAIFRSFIKLIEYLNEQGIEYTIALRTFGSDLDRIVEEADRRIVPGFFSSLGEFKGGHLHLDRTYEEAGAIYGCFMDRLSQGQNMGVKEDWEPWAKSGESRAFAKVFPVHLDDPDVISLFFDDNVRYEEIRNIVNPIDAKTGLPLSIVDLIDKQQIIEVDTIEAMLDEDYFIKKIESVLQT